MAGRKVAATESKAARFKHCSSFDASERKRSVE